MQKYLHWEQNQLKKMTNKTNLKKGFFVLLQLCHVIKEFQNNWIFFYSFHALWLRFRARYPWHRPTVAFCWEAQQSYISLTDLVETISGNVSIYCTMLTDFKSCTLGQGCYSSFSKKFNTFKIIKELADLHHINIFTFPLHWSSSRGPADFRA